MAERMEPEELLKQWSVNYKELAELCGSSKSTGAHWFSVGEHRKEPSEADKRRSHRCASRVSIVYTDAMIVCAMTVNLR